jgi:hypothetical protein
LLLSVLSHVISKIVISTEAARAVCEQRSGEIRFSTSKLRSFIAFCRYPYFSFAIFCPKIACQAPKPPKPLRNNNIRVAY